MGNHRYTLRLFLVIDDDEDDDDITKLLQQISVR